MSMNFWKPMSDPKPASVHTASTSLSAIWSATTDELPWAMLANGPAWTKAGPPSSVWTRLGFIASRMQDGHRAGDLELVEGHRLAVVRLGDDGTAEPLAQVADAVGQGERLPSPLTRR